MKQIYPCLTLGWLLVVITVSAQNGIRLKNGTINPEANVTEAVLNRFNAMARKKADTSYILLQFKKNPSTPERNALRQAGISLIQYIPINTFIAQVTQPLTTSRLRNAGVNSIIELKPEHKISAALQSRQKEALEVTLSFFETVSYLAASANLVAQGFTITNTQQKAYHFIQVKVPAGRLLALASLPFVQSIESLPPSPVPLNFKGRSNARTNVLQSRLPGAYNLTGEGVKIAIGELYGVFPNHVDYNDREINVSSDSGPFGAHSHHVHGIAAGAGLINELYTGHAPGATILAMTSSDPQNLYAIQDHHFEISNNSWGSGGVCYYEAYSQFHYPVDRQAVDFNNLQHVFAAGNSGNTTCKAYPSGFGTIYSGIQSAKSILTVGNTLANGQISAGSSKGPTNAGLIKPEVVTTGTTIFSTIPNNTYGTNTGTSMAAPVVAGGLALLYQRYRQLNNGSNPKNSLMKAIVCNTATDLGNTGPDFSYGFGWLNLLRAVQAIDNRSYLVDSISDQSVKMHQIAVPAGAAKLKIMLYWQDPPASLLSASHLVHDLDLQIATPDGATVLPYVLDTLPANVTNPATHGVDHINNIEQVVIDNPQTGNYTITIKGTDIAQNPMQEYVIVYDIVPNDIRLTFPNGGEGLNPGETVAIQWDASGEASSTFTLQYSENGGTAWQDINTNIAADARQYNWQISANPTSKGLIRLIRNNDDKSSVSQPFVIAAVPTASLAATQCPGYISLQWTPSPGATDYEVMMVQNGKMVSIDSTTATNYLFKNLSEEKTYWVTVRARIDGKPGRRAIAISRNPSNGTCAGTISDHDLKPVALLAPLYGRELTSDSLTGNTTIRVRLKNMDDQPVPGFFIQYSVNGGAWIAENTNTPLAAFAESEYSFNTTYNFTALGDYALKVVVNATGDSNPANDTLTYVVRNVANPVIDLSSPVMDLFEQTTVKKYTSAAGAFTGAERFDYKKTSGSGSFDIIDYAVSATGGKGFVLRRSINGNHDVWATYNLSMYDTASFIIGLEFNYSKTAVAASGNDRLWVRGNDTAAWIEIMNLDPGANTSVSDKRVQDIRITDWLKLGHQNFSASTQLRWSQESSPADFAFDSITIFDAGNDVEMVSIDSFRLMYCEPGNAISVHVTLRNASGKVLNNVPVKYQVNGGGIVEETIAVLPSGAPVSFTFATQVNISATGYHTIEAWADLPADKLAANNRKTITIRSQAMVSNFPYLENFEQGDGGWYAAGEKSSWEYGTPASAKISGAASGNKAWKTKLAGSPNDFETSYLYSPCLNFSGLNRPTISISMSVNIDSCGLFCDAFRLQYSINGIDWRNVSTMTTKKFKQWQVHTAFLPLNIQNLQLRFSYRSDAFNNFDGVAIDDVHIYDSTITIYDLGANSQPVTQTLNGNQWIDFKQDGKIIASINPNGQNLGVTTLQAFLRDAAGNFHGQYYLNRSFSIQSSKDLLSDSVSVRLYFLNTETENLLFAKNCLSCKKPLHAYRFGISQYHSRKLAELNGELSDNVQGDWSFINNSAIKTVPYQKGYYSEFKVNGFSELWLSNGGYDNNSHLPVAITEFTAKPLASGNVELKWTTGAEINIDHFDIEVAAGNEAYANNVFGKESEMSSHGASPTEQQYTFEANGNNKTGVNYYRIKVVDEFGNYAYSKGRPVVFSNELKWIIAPNHSGGLYKLIYQVNEGETVQLEIFNSIGSLIKREQFTGIGFIGQHVIDLQNTVHAKGLYLVRVHTKDQARTFRIVKK